MSIEVMSLVWKSSQHRGSSLLVLLAIADFCHDDGRGAWPSVKTLAVKARLKERAVQYALADLESSGELIVQRKAGPRDVNLYEIQVDKLSGARCAPTSPLMQNSAPPSNLDGAQNTKEVHEKLEVVHGEAPNPSLNRHIKPLKDSVSWLADTKEPLFDSVMRCCNRREELLTPKLRREMSDMCTKLRSMYQGDTDERIGRRIEGFGHWWCSKSNGGGEHFSAPTPSVVLSHWQNFADYCKNHLDGGLPSKVQDTAA